MYVEKWNFHDNASMEGEEIQPRENSVPESCAIIRKITRNGSEKTSN